MRTWSAFRRHCAEVMGDHYVVIFFEHTDGKCHSAVVLVKQGEPIDTITGPTRPTRESALAAGMDIVRAKLRLRRN